MLSTSATPMVTVAGAALQLAGAPTVCSCAHQPSWSTLATSKEGSADRLQCLQVPATLQQIDANYLTKVKELGRGQFGSVWLSRWLGVEVAVKELHTANSMQSSAEMYQEADTLNSLRHPCIIAFYGVVVNQVSAQLRRWGLQTHASAAAGWVSADGI